jgi:hypothetical protein
LVARVTACLLALAGCASSAGETIGRTALAPQLRADGTIDGVQAEATAGYHGVQLGLGAFWDRLQRPMDPALHSSGGIEVLGRASLFGLFADDHALERYFDVGFEGGAGGGFAHPASLEGIGRLWGGGWVDIGIGGDSYPALALGVRQVTYSGAWNTETVFTVGIALIARAGDPLWFPK